LSFRYSPDDPLVLDRVSFRLPAGTRTALRGPSGAGKSTIVNLLLRFWEYESGSITLGGHDLRAFRADDLRSLFGVMPQDIHLFNGTLRDNLLLADAGASDEHILAACRLAQLEGFIQHLPHGLDTLIGENGLLLSGGERQRLAIARVILKDAPIVILDEPTANLDPVTAQALIDALAPYLAGRTTLIISHQHVAFEGADQVIEVEGGRAAMPRHVEDTVSVSRASSCPS
jgi:ABC-type multidrug transport system fused ATPase/permease subunit